MGKPSQTVPVIDLFAGPGGLSEGFTAFRRAHLSYDVALSIEKDCAAHRTLELRAFFRHFRRGRVPQAYYRYCRGEIARDELFAKFPHQADAARRKAWAAELGCVSFDEVTDAIQNAVDGAPYWVLLGGPPCQAYSTIGRARRMSDPAFEDDHRHTLYREYMKIVAALKPTVFVMENVKGILSSKHRKAPVFSKILEDMREPATALSREDSKSLPPDYKPARYRLWSFTTEALWDEALEPKDYLIRSEQYGVPQFRHRVIILGVRDDYKAQPQPLESIEEYTAVGDVIGPGQMPRIRSRRSRSDGGGRDWASAIRRECDKHVQASVDDKDVRRRLKEVLRSLPLALESGGSFVPGEFVPSKLRSWFHDPKLGGVVQHQSRSHMDSDLARYLFAACYADVHGSAPRIHDFPECLWPAHRSVAKRASDGRGYFADRFRVQVGGQPATTVTSHLRADGHYYIHPDPTQCRSLTVREAARLQTFPDNYFFEGNRTQQFVQVGNAVPPFLAYQMADVVGELIAECRDEDTSHRRVA